MRQFVVVRSNNVVYHRHRYSKTRLVNAFPEDQTVDQLEFFVIREFQVLRNRLNGLSNCFSSNDRSNDVGSM